jgi:hypothetical protein
MGPVSRTITAEPFQVLRVRRQVSRPGNRADKVSHGLEPGCLLFHQAFDGLSNDLRLRDRSLRRDSRNLVRVSAFELDRDRTRKYRHAVTVLPRCPGVKARKRVNVALVALVALWRRPRYGDRHGHR